MSLHDPKTSDLNSLFLQAFLHTWKLGLYYQQTIFFLNALLMEAVIKLTREAGTTKLWGAVQFFFFSTRLKIDLSNSDTIISKTIDKFVSFRQNPIFGQQTVLLTNMSCGVSTTNDSINTKHVTNKSSQ